MAVTQVLGIVLVWLSLMKNVEIYSLNVDGSGREKSTDKDKLLVLRDHLEEFDVQRFPDSMLRAIDQVVANLEWSMLSDPDLEGRSV